MYKFSYFVPHLNLNGLGPVHTRPKELENGGFTLKTHQMFIVHTAPEEFKNAKQSPVILDLLDENSVREITCLS